MNIYLLTQDVENGYDTFDSCVVIAANEELARNTHPYTEVYTYVDGEEHNSYREQRKSASRAWAQYSKDISVELLGTADKEPGVILASFNAG